MQYALFRHLRTLLLSAGFGLAAALAQAQPYSNLYVFGDSLSDTGNDLIVTFGGVPSPAYYAGGGVTGRFSNGLNYADHLAAGLGLGPLLPSEGGGSNYAFGGARMNSVQVGLPPTALSFNQQLADYEGDHALADPDALYVLWIGANDLRDGLTLAALGNPTAVSVAINTVLTGLGGAIQNLAGRGATHFLVPNMPDLSLTPAVRGFNNPFISAGAQGASMAFNSALGGVLLGAAALGWTCTPWMSSGCRRQSPTIPAPWASPTSPAPASAATSTAAASAARRWWPVSIRTNTCTSTTSTRPRRCMRNSVRRRWPPWCPNRQAGPCWAWA